LFFEKRERMTNFYGMEEMLTEDWMVGMFVGVLQW